MIKSVIIHNFKCFKGSMLIEFKSGLNILVGNNETGKSTVLEAIHLALSGTFKGKFIQGNLTQYLFNNEVVNEYLESVKLGNPIEPPYILIELYLDNTYPELEGDRYTDTEVTGRIFGVALRIAFDEKYNDEYYDLIKSCDLSSLPIEYYDIEWYSFARKALTTRSIPLKSTLIDVGFSKFQNGSDVYISRIIQNVLDSDDKTKVTQAFRKVKELFIKDSSISEINKKLTGISVLSKKQIELNVDLSSKSTWEGSLITQLDNIPFDFIGKGEQAIIKTELALSNKKAESSSVILMEEPESHISHSRLNQLINSIKENYGNKQIILSTHSSFVANKLGLNNLILLNKDKTFKFSSLNSMDFFEKISGYDTLRLILCNKAILVEGDSDELIVQRAYLDVNNGHLPIEDGVEVISVGTSFLRFLDIADNLKIDVKVLTDNDGDIGALKLKYKDYLDNNKKDNIEICYENKVFDGNLVIGIKEKPFNYNTLEPSLFRSNNLDLLNKVLETEYINEDDLHKYMKANKTECALKIFSSDIKITYPEYILRAIK